MARAAEAVEGGDAVADAVGAGLAGIVDQDRQTGLYAGLDEDADAS